jgi:hypothetical protein
MEAETPPISPWGYADAVPVSDLPDPVPEGTRYWSKTFGGWVDARTHETFWAAVPKPCDPPIDPSFAKALHSDPGEELDTDALEEALSTYSHDRNTSTPMSTDKPTNVETPTPPEGYELRRGSDIDRPYPVGLLAWVPVEGGWGMWQRAVHRGSLFSFGSEWYAVPTTPTPAASISEEAAAVVAGDRAADYGDVSESFARIAKLWSAYTGTTVSPWDVAQMMILLKVSRAKTSTKRDTLVDIAGYAECAGQLKQTD